MKAFHNCGYERRDLAYFERVVPLQPQEVGLLGELGGRILPGGLWEALAGMEHEKQVIERRIVLPLEDRTWPPSTAFSRRGRSSCSDRPGRARRRSPRPSRRGSGGRSSRSSPPAWPPRGDGQALALRDTFAEIDALEHAVVFIDEVEEIAGRRGGKPPPPQQGVTNELLKIIPTFRERDGRLLVCATNFVRALDPAFLRHGRFDYVIPVGAPDAAARAAIWRRYLPAGALDRIDVDALVEASELFTPADIEFAARKGSQRALEIAVYGDERDRPEVRGPATADYLAALGETRPTLTPAIVEEFNEDIETIARL